MSSVSLIRTSLFSLIAVFVRLTSALALNKILAVLVGSSGFALIGQLQNIVSITASFTGGAISNGVVKYTAEYFDNEKQQQAVWQTAIRMSLWSSVFVGAVVFLVREPLATWLFHRTDLTNVLIWLVIALPGIGANAVMLAILNGKKEVKGYVLANIAGSILGLFVIGGLSLAFGVRGALVAVAVNPTISIIASAAIVARMPWFKHRYFWGRTNKVARIQLTKYAMMAFVTALCTPVAQMLVRNHLGETFGWTSAGYWQAVVKISEMYLMLITMTLGVYYLPRIAEIRDAMEMKAEIIKVYYFTLPITMIGAFAIYALRNELVRWLFTPEFSPMVGLFAWQLSGDVIKIAAWVLGYVLIGKSATVAFISTEIIFSIMSVALTIVLTEIYGLVGVTIAHFINYLLYLLVLVVIVSRLMYRNFGEK